MTASGLAWRGERPLAEPGQSLVDVTEAVQEAQARLTHRAHRCPGRNWWEQYLVQSSPEWELGKSSPEVVATELFIGERDHRRIRLVDGVSTHALNAIEAVHVHHCLLELWTDSTNDLKLYLSSDHPRRHKGEADWANPRYLQAIHEGRLLPFSELRPLTRAALLMWIRPASLRSILRDRQWCCQSRQLVEAVAAQA